MQPQPSSQNQQTQFQYVTGQLIRGQGNFVFRPMTVEAEEEFPLIVTSADAVVVPDIGKIVVQGR